LDMLPEKEAPYSISAEVFRICVSASMARAGT
jgi:hypothetical protein